MSLSETKHVNLVKLLDEDNNNINSTNPIQISNNYDSEMDANAHISHFGALKTSGTQPVLKGNFPGSSLDTNVWNKIEIGGGTLTVAKGVADMNVGTTSGDRVKLLSVRQGIFEAGQVTVYQSGTMASAPKENVRQCWGLMTTDEQNGIFFETNGSGFSVITRKDNVETKISKSSFNGDTTFEPDGTNNTYRIHYSAGRAIFQRSTSGGKIITLHTLVDNNLPLTSNLDMGLYYDISNLDTTASSTLLRVRGSSSSIFGNLPTIRANENINDNTVMKLSKTILTARDSEGNYVNIPSNKAGAILTGDFNFEVAQGNVNKYRSYRIIGSNPDVDSNTAPENIISTGGLYSGHGSETETLEIFSNNADDDSSGVGMRTIRITGLKTNISTTEETEDIILNGTTSVNSTNQWFRVYRAEGLTYGTNGINSGTITIRHQITTTNVFVVIQPNEGVSTYGIFTIPEKNVGFITSMFLSMARPNGGSGSASISVRQKSINFGGPGNIVQQFFLSTNYAANPIINFPIFQSRDIAFRIDTVSDNNSQFNISVEIMIVDEKGS